MVYVYIILTIIITKVANEGLMVYEKAYNKSDYMFCKLFNIQKVKLINSILALIVIGCMIFFRLDSIENMILIVIPLLFINSIIDLLFKELSDDLTITIAIIGMIKVMMLFLENDSSIAIQGLATGMSLFMIYLGISFFVQLGGGDIKLIGALGFFFSYKDILVLLNVPVILTGVGIGILFIISLIKKEKMKETIALGPYIALGSLIVYFIK